MARIQPSVAYSQRLMPITIDRIAEETPERLFACIPRSSNLKDGFEEISVGDFARAISRISWWMEEVLGKCQTFETLAYMGPSDLRYFILILAANKVGYKVLLPSPRNSVAGQLSLFSETSCNFLLTTPSFQVQQLLDERPMRLIHVPELNYMLSADEVPHYQFKKTFDEAKDDPFVIIHTSGSTGLPKAIILPHLWVTTIDNQLALHQHDGYDSTLKGVQGKRVFCSLPPFHGAGLAVNLITALFGDSPVIWAPSDRPMSTPLVEEVLDSANVEVLFLAPSMLEELSQSPEALEKLAKLHGVHFGGGPLSRHAGDIISKKVPLRNTLGATEIATIPVFQVASEDWEYFHSDPDFKGMEFRDRGDGTYELILVRHQMTDLYHSAFITFPHLTEYRMNDLFTKHPSKPNYWLYVGRADDIIVLSNGEKVNPVSMEATLRNHPGVNGALVVGQGEFSTAAVIELRPDIAKNMSSGQDRARFIDSLWPFAVSANEKAPAHAQLAQDRITLAPVEKRFLRAAKGTIQRAATVNFFQGEIQEMYQRTNDEEFTGFPKVDVNQDPSSLAEALRKLIGTVWDLQGLAADQDLFSSGMDSLHVMTLVKRLKSVIVGNGFSKDKIDTRMIYQNPSLAMLTATLKAIGKATNTTAIETPFSEERENKIQEMLEKYLKELPTSTKGKLRDTGSGLTVILTGSTGSLGSYLLDTLATSNRISKVYCLNRKADAEQVQAKSNECRGILSKWGKKVVFLQTSLSNPNFGLPDDVFEGLQNEVTVVIHNQWQVDFNLSLSSFEPHIVGTLNLIKFSASSPHSPPIFFTSSIGTVGNWYEKHPNQLVPEIALDDPSLPEHQGYSESKWISERLLATATKKSGVSAAICRVGQIAGPVGQKTGGMWNRQEWLPSIIASSKYIGAIPSSLAAQEEVSWTPVDILAKIIVELMLSDSQIETTWTKYYHLDNPMSCKWSSLVPIIQKHFSVPNGSNCQTVGEREDGELKVVSLSEWVEKLEASGKEQNLDLAQNPGLKLLEFYQGMDERNGVAKLDTKETCERSQVMRDLKAVDGEWMKLWLEQWAF